MNMKTVFPQFFIPTFICNLLIILLLIFFSACNKKPKPVFDLASKGSEVVASYNDSTPQVVYYYKLDKNGKPTQEKVGVAEFYQNKQPYISGGLKNNKREGRWNAFFPDGSVQTEAFYIDGEPDGDYIVYRENGNMIYKGHFNHGICDGTWYFYYPNGSEERKIVADENTIACESCPKCRKLKYN